MNDDATLWSILQVSFPEQSQQHIFSNPMPRRELIRKAFEFIPANVRTTKGQNKWGLADLESVSDDLLTGKLTVISPYAKVAEEPQPGILTKTPEPRFFTLMVLHIPLQIIAVQRTSDISRFARSPKSFAAIFQDLLSQAVVSLNQNVHYDVVVEPIGKSGSFTQWCNTLDTLNKIVIHYVGPNLPAGHSQLIEDIRNTAKSFKRTLKSKNVDLVANQPQLEAEEIQELDEAAAQRRLSIRARGTRSGVGIGWDSTDKIVPETAKVPLTEGDLSDSQEAGAKIGTFLEDYFDKQEE